jgi:hypothetical protein
MNRNNSENVFRFEMIGVVNNPEFAKLNPGDTVKMSNAVRRYKWDNDAKCYMPHKDMKHDRCLYAFAPVTDPRRIGADYAFHMAWVDGYRPCKATDTIQITADMYDALPDDFEATTLERNNEVVDPTGS